MQLQIMTIGTFVASIDTAEYFLIEKHQTPRGFYALRVPVKECEISEVAQQQVTILWDNLHDSAVISQLNQPDPATIVIKNRRVAFEPITKRIRHCSDDVIEICKDAATQAINAYHFLQQQQTPEELYQYAQELLDIFMQDVARDEVYTDDPEFYREIFAREFIQEYTQAQSQDDEQ